MLLFFEYSFLGSLLVDFRNMLLAVDKSFTLHEVFLLFDDLGSVYVLWVRMDYSGLVDSGEGFIEVDQKEGIEGFDPNSDSTGQDCRRPNKDLDHNLGSGSNTDFDSSSDFATVHLEAVPIQEEEECIAVHFYFMSPS